MKDFDTDKVYTNEDFDKMLIPLYSDDGYPYLDQFEYMDAVYNNMEVEKLRKEYFSQKQEKRRSEE